jgi:hypothetical protein
MLEYVKFIASNDIGTDAASSEELLISQRVGLSKK